MENHLSISTAFLWALIIIYSQILFTISKHAYPYSGIAYLVTLIGGVIYHIVGIIWIAEEDCTDTDWYMMGLANTIVFYVFALLILIGALIIFFVGNSKKGGKKIKPQSGSAEMSEERMLGNQEENKNNQPESSDEGKKEIKTKDKDSNAEEHKEGETVDKDKNDKKDEEEDLEEEEIY